MPVLHMYINSGYVFGESKELILKWNQKGKREKRL
jgi:hypothetical protein